jgi:hypothetical protein
MSDDLEEIDLNLDEDRDEAFDDTRLIQDDGGEEDDEVSAKIDWKTVIPLGVLQFVERWNSDSIYAFVSWLGEYPTSTRCVLLWGNTSWLYRGA